MTYENVITHPSRRWPQGLTTIKRETSFFKRTTDAGWNRTRDPRSDSATSFWLPRKQEKQKEFVKKGAQIYAKM